MVTNTAAQKGGANAIELLKSDHRKVEKLFEQYEKAEDRQQKQKLARQVCKELIIHTLLEEEIFYPACRERNVDTQMMDEAQVEHDGAKTLITELIEGTPADAYYDAKVSVLSEYIKHHVGEEEEPRTGIFARAQKAGVNVNELGTKLQTRKQQLMAAIDENRLEPPRPRSLHVQEQQQSQEKQQMPRQSNYRERDEYGRFMSDEDDERGGGYEGRRGGHGHGGWYGDPEGHSEASRSRSSGYSSRGRYEDEDDDRRGRRGQGGWFGDSEGHSEASEKGWEHRGSSRGGARGRYEDDDYDRGSRGNYRPRDDEGRFMSENGRRGGRGGHGGWFGDREGHSEASERGWEHRGSSRGGYSSRERDYDHRRGGRGHGGWYGDPEGHSQASRRGWEDR